MIELWIPITILAAAIQAARTTIQKYLKSSLKTNSITFVRFFYGWPFALLYLVLLLALTGAEMPPINTRFLIGCFMGGLAQIAATSLLILSFSYRNFAVGTTYSKTEAVQTAVLGIVLFGEPLGLLAMVGIVVSLVGVVVISSGKTGDGLSRVLLGWSEKPALIGIASGTGFAFAALFIRWGSLSLDADFGVRAAMTLAYMTFIQTVMLGAWILVREPGEFRPILASWRSSGAVGFLSAVGSATWFTALTLQTAAYVRALGQVELILSLLISYLFFKERSSVAEIVGMVVIVAGVILLVL